MLLQTKIIAVKIGIGAEHKSFTGRYIAMLFYPLDCKPTGTGNPLI